MLLVVTRHLDIAYPERIARAHASLYGEGIAGLGSLVVLVASKRGCNLSLAFTHKCYLAFCIDGGSICVG